MDITKSRSCGFSLRWEAGEKVADVCRKAGVSEATYYAWKKKYAGLGVTELRELRQLREENGKLKPLVADLSLDRHILQEIVAKTIVKPRRRRELAQWVERAYRVSQRRAARLVPSTPPAFVISLSGIPTQY